MPETLLMAGHMADWIAVSEILRNLAIVGAATIGLGLAWWRTAALNRQAASGAVQAAVSRREHAADVFSRAVGQIGSDRVEVRIGANSLPRGVEPGLPGAESAHIRCARRLLSNPVRGFQGGEVATGVVEGGCKNIVGARLKHGGMRWTVAGANAIIRTSGTSWL